MTTSLPSLPAGYADRMPRFPEAPTLRLVGCDVFGRDGLLAPDAAVAWEALRETAEKDGAPLLLLSGFRSFARQEEILRRKLAAGQPWGDILAVSAYPGFSEHHTGRAVDIGAPGYVHLTEDFERSPQFAWLIANARRFGFALSYPKGNRYGIAYEPWHWCLKGRPHHL